MGIANLHPFLLEKAPSIYERKHLSEMRGWVVAVDTNLFMHRMKIKSDNWVGSFVQFVYQLRVNGVHPYFVFDSKSHELKADTLQLRRMRRQSAWETISNLETALEAYLTGEPASEVLTQLMAKLRPRQDPAAIDIKSVKREITRLYKQVVKITHEEIAVVKELLGILGYMYQDADEEAETVCSQLCIHGAVDAVLSNDSDVLAYGAPILLHMLHDSGMVSVIHHQKVLDALQLTYDAFLDFCIMCGTDYNHNIFRIGPTKAYLHIKQHQTIENVRDALHLDVSVLKHELVRERFHWVRNPPTLQLNRDELCAHETDYDAFREFLRQRNIALFHVDNFKNTESVQSTSRTTIADAYFAKRMVDWPRSATKAQRRLLSPFSEDELE